MDPLVRRLADATYARAYRKWIDSLVEQAGGANRPATDHPRSRPSAHRGRRASFRRSVRKAPAFT
jgi:hypothetical protein